LENTSIFGIKFLSDKIQANASIKDIFSQRKAEMKTELSKWSGKLDRGEIFDEESNQDDFTNAVFKPLGYTKSGDAVPWTIKREYKTSGAKSVDLAIGYFKVGEDEDETVFAVAEYKSPLSKDLSRRPSKDMSPVEQAFDYASKIGHSCRWVIVSNMVEIRLYNSASQKRYETFNIHELAKEPIKLERFHFLLCKENFLPSESAKESFLDKIFAQNIEDQQTINAKFYSVYRQVREKFFMKLIESNPEVDRATLLEKTQKVIDRFIFICFCEDKNFIGKSTLNEDPTDFIMNAPKKIFGGRIWDQFRQFSKAINDGSETPIKIPSYNGGLFEPDPDLDKLEVPNEAIEFFRDISDYDFNSTLDVNILGHIFEQSVSDIEELKAIAIDHVDFDRKKGKRKRQGIFYTPSWITGFIIEQTIGAWIEREKSNAGFGDLPVMSGEEDLILEKIHSNQKVKLPKTLEEKAKIHCNAWKKLQEKLLGIKVLDPACGSGAFLNKAFEYLVDAHKEIQSQINHFSMSKNDGQLTAGDKIDDYVVRNNLFGVDLSKESVEITKLSLWLRLVYHKEKLPVLNHAVKYGDSIVSDPKYSKAAFDWQGKFGHIVQFDPETGNQEQGSGFDVVIGNPPYVRQEFLSPIKPALQNIYGDFYNGVADLYTYFYRRGFQLLKPDGYLGFITSSTFTKTGSGKQTRLWLQNNVSINSFVDFGILQLWEGDAANLVCILIGQNNTPTKEHSIKSYKIASVPDVNNLQPFDDYKPIMVKQANLGVDAWNFDKSEVEALRTKIFSKGRPLKEIVPAIYRGILTGLNEAFIIDKATKDRLIKEELELRSKSFASLDKGGARRAEGSESDETQNPPTPLNNGGYEQLTHNTHPLIKPFLVGRDLKQWHYDYQDRYLIFTRHGTDIDQYPAIKKYLEQFRERLEPKPLNLPESESRNLKGRKPGPYKWFEIQDNIAYYKAFEEPKVVYPEFMITPKFTIDLGGNYFNNKVYFLINGQWFISSILSSRIIWFVIKQRCAVKLGNVYELFTIYVENFPIVEPQGSEDDPATDKGKLALLAKTAQDKAFKRLQLRKDLLESVSDALNQSKSGDDGDSEEVSEGSDINRWDTMDWNSFTKKAQSPSAFGKAFRDTFAVIGKKTTELKRYFEELGKECRQLTCEIHECEKQINEIVYRLYDLTPDEIKLLEELTGNIYED